MASILPTAAMGAARTKGDITMKTKKPTTAPAEATPLKTFRVTLSTWDKHRVIVQASDEAQAEAIAEALWDDNPDAFDWYNGGGDMAEAEEVA
jgi:DNA polymerase IIIc chi subunit